MRFIHSTQKAPLKARADKPGRTHHRPHGIKKRFASGAEVKRGSSFVQLFHFQHSPFSDFCAGKIASYESV
jgi:hypothetical protein